MRSARRGPPELERLTRRIGMLVASFALGACTGSPGARDAGPDTLGPPPLACGAPVPDPADLRCFSPLTFTLRAQNTRIDEACLACSEAMCDAEATAAFGADGLRISPDAPAGDCADLVACAAACACGDAGCQYDCVTRIGCTALNPLLGCLRTRCEESCLPSGRCGDGALGSSEQCEPGLPAGSCRQVGMSDGTLTCTRACRWDSSECLRDCCGDGRLARDEQCDGEALASLTCELLGFDEGALGCDARCRLDTSGCTGDGGRCGDGVVTPFLGEVCDGAASVLGTCADLGYAEGAIGCSDDCTEHDVARCAPRPLGPGGACAEPIVPAGTVSPDGLLHFLGSTRGSSTREVASCGASEGPEAVYELVFAPGPMGLVGVVDLEGHSIRGVILSLRESCEPSSEVACSGASVLTVSPLSTSRRYLLFVDGAEPLPAFEVFVGPV